MSGGGGYITAVPMNSQQGLAVHSTSQQVAASHSKATGSHRRFVFCCDLCGVVETSREFLCINVVHVRTVIIVMLMIIVILVILRSSNHHKCECHNSNISNMINHADI